MTGKGGHAASATDLRKEIPRKASTHFPTCTSHSMSENMRNPRRQERIRKMARNFLRRSGENGFAKMLAPNMYKNFSAFPGTGYETFVFPQSYLDLLNLKSKLQIVAECRRGFAYAPPTKNILPNIFSNLSFSVQRW
jgi:hypothetical protein